MTTELKSIIKALPNEAGVYQFFSNRGEKVPLYIGKSNSIRKRVLSHLSMAKTDAKENRLMSQVNYITYERTGGELGALLREATLIKKYQPIYNRRLRRIKRLYLYKIIKNNDILMPELVSSNAENFTFNKNTFGLYRSQRQAKEALITLAKGNDLCFKMMGIERGKGSCFNYQLNKCQGVCFGVENINEYNERFQQAIITQKNIIWPYDKHITISEGEGEWQTIHVIDQWYYLGNCKNEGEIDNLVEKNLRSSFDIDHYKILINFMGKLDQ